MASIDYLDVRSATIAHDDEDTGVIDLCDSRLCAIETDANILGSQFTFSASADDDSPLLDVYDDDGTEIHVDMGASRHVEIAPTLLRGVRYIKIKTATGQTAENGTTINVIAARLL